MLAFATHGITAALLAGPALAAEGEVAPSDPVLERVAPEIPEGVEAYPHLHRASCEVSFRIAKDGSPKKVESRGCPLCYMSASLAAANQWRFVPGTRRYSTTFTYRVDVTQPEPSPAVVEQRDDGELLVSISIPGLDLDVALETNFDDSVTFLPIDRVTVLKKVPPSMSDIGYDTLRSHQRWFDLEQVSCHALILVDEHGRVGGWHPIACDPLFYDAVSNALPRWRWEPWLVEGEPTAFAFRMSFVFNVRDETGAP